MYKRIDKEKQTHCLICFKSLYEDIYLSNFFATKSICRSCQDKFKKIELTNYILGVETFFIYEYNKFMKDLLFQFKGCYDVKLKAVFLENYKKIINKKYKNYIIVFPPSNEKENYKRGFNHIEKIVECLKLKSEDLFIKSKEFKQSSMSFKDRANIEKIIKLKEGSNIKSECKYLIIDDVFTSGSTLKTIIKILLKSNVKKENIKSIIIAKSVENVEL